MNNPMEILRVFDAHLEHRTELTLFGRSAIALGFSSAPPEYLATLDVDAILSLPQLELFREQQFSFWLAQQATNRELDARGLYMTHLFSEVDVIVQPDWTTRRVSITAPLKNVALFRPSVVDLILTKMARADTQDLKDIEFLFHQEPVSTAEIGGAFSRARVPDVAEVQALFSKAKPKVLAIAKRIEQTRLVQ
jgi:hypothetical protein